MTSTQKRRALIRTLIRKAQIESQKELLEQLAAEGVQSTQPVVSRDLRAMKVVKRDGVYVLLDQDHVTPLENLRSLLRGVKTAGPNLLVVKCEPGAANAVARALEAEKPAGLIGAVAGDDTIFAAVQSRSAGTALRRLISSHLLVEPLD